MGPAGRKAVPLLKSTMAKSKHFISYDDFLLSRTENWYKNEIEAFDYVVFYEYASTIAEALLILDDTALPGEISEWHHLIQENAKIKHWTGLNNLKMVFAPIVSGLAISLTAGGTVYGLRQVFKSMKVQTGHVSPDSRDRAMLSVDDIKRELHSSQDGRLLAFRKLEYKLQQHHQVLRYWPNTFDIENIETLRDMSDIVEIFIIGESGAYTITPGYLIEHWSAWKNMRERSDGMMIVSVGEGTEKIAILDMHQDDFIEGNARDFAMLTDNTVLLGTAAIAAVIGFKGLTFLANKYGYKKVSHYAFLIALTGSLICMAGCKPNKEDHSSKQSEAQDTQNGISVKPAIGGENFKDAFEKKNYSALQGFLSLQPDFLQASGNDYYLGVAAKLGDVKMVEFLLNHGANPDGVFQERTVLERAISGSFENKEIALLLIKKGADLTKINSLLIGAIENQWISVAAAILEKGADINEVRASDGMTALMVAIANGNDSAVKMLIDNGADVDLPMLNGVTPLMVAVKRQDLEMVRRLLKNGANPLIKDVNEKTAIDIAKGYTNEIIQNILQAFHPESKMNIFTMGKSMDPVGVLISKMQIESSTGSKNEVNNIPEEYIEVGEVLKLFSRSVLLDDVKIAKEAFLQADGSKHLFWREGDIMALMLAIKNHANNVAMFMLENRPILKNSQDVVLALSLATNNDDFMRKYAAYVKDISYLSEGVAFQIYVKLLEKRDLSLMEELLKKGLPVNFFGMQNLTPLDLTVLSGQFKATAMLLNYGADPLLLRSSAELSLYSSSLLNMIKMSDNRSYSSILKSIAPYHPDNVKIILEVMDGNIAQVRTLIRNGANVNMSTPSGMNPLQLAVESENFEMVELLVQNGANVNHPGFLKSTPFLSAIISANQKLIDFLIKNGAKLDVANDRGDTPIMLAAETNNLSLGKYLIEKGININQQNRFLKSPLTAAAYHGNILFVKLLVDSGVDLKSQGGMAAYQAAMRGHHQVLEFLLQQGVSPTYEYHVPGSFIGSIMAAAVNAGQIQSVSVLLKHGVDINAKMGFDILARTPLHSAVISNNFQMAEFLLNNGADIKKEILMVPVLHAAMFQGGPELIRLLIKSGCDINQSAGDLLRTPAHEAADLGNLKALEVLSESGADLTKKDADGKLPVDLAREKGHKDIVDFFEQSFNADQSMLGSTAELMAKVMSVGLMGAFIQSQAIATQVLASYDPIAPILDAAKAEQMAKMILIGVGAVALAGVTAFLTYRYFHNIKKTGKDNMTQDHVSQKSTETDISDHAMLGTTIQVISLKEIDQIGDVQQKRQVLYATMIRYAKILDSGKPLDEVRDNINNLVNMVVKLRITEAGFLRRLSSLIKTCYEKDLFVDVSELQKLLEELNEINLLLMIDLTKVADDQYKRTKAPDAESAPGGIDFNPQGLDLKIKRDGNGIPLPLPQQPLEIIQIEGLTPVIINVVPANIPMMLGLKEDDEIELSLN
jgi:ankyrin repeat protein